MKFQMRFFRDCSCSSLHYFNGFNQGGVVHVLDHSNAQRFYESFGFRSLGEIPFSTDLAEIGMVVMCRDLSR